MKGFIRRIEKAYNSQGAWDSESLTFKSFMWFLVCWIMIFRFIYSLIAFITVPVWIIPYMIYDIHKNKKK